MNDSRTRSSAPAPSPTAAATLQSNLANVGASRIYFGHQSVGANILDGLRELSAESRALNIISTRALGGVSTPGFIEFTIGDNGNPASKASDFAAALEAGASSPAIAMFKYCYLDVTAQTDVARAFAAHRDSVRALQARHPRVTFVHVTAPLTTAEPASKALVKRLMGKTSSRDANRKRNEFNTLVRREFADEPIFDLARVESSRPDGSRASFVSGGETVYTLAPELTDDGGHLNADGRRAAAIELLAVLSSAVSGASARR